MAHQQKVAEADDRRQQVVEVVRDAAGELADRLHLLALRDLHLERALLGGVDGVGDGRLVVAVGLLDRAQIDPAAALLVADKGDVHGLDQPLPGEGGIERAAEGLVAVGLDQTVEPHFVAVVAGAEQPHEGGVGGADEALRVHRGDGDGGRMEQPGKSELGGARLFRFAGAATQYQRMSQARRSCRRAGDDAGCAPAGWCRRP